MQQVEVELTGPTVDTSIRKVGEAMSNDKLQSLEANTLIGRVGQFIRTDFGGEEHKERVALQRALHAQPELETILSKLTAEEQRFLGTAIVAVAKHACEGSRKRIATTVEEMKRRWVVTVPKTPAVSCLKI